MRLMKLVLLGIIFISLVGGVSGQTAGNCVIEQGVNVNTANEVILLEVSPPSNPSNPSNLHAAKVNSNNPIADTNHWYVSCLKSDVGSSEDYVCEADRSNEIIRLYSDTNSHAWIPHGDTTYPTQVCYKDLACTWELNPNPSYNINVLSLSDAGNAHVGEFTGYQIIYPIRCKDTSGPSCTDDCSPDEAEITTCKNQFKTDTYTCGPNYDADPCLEWSPPATTDCPANQQCYFGGECDFYCGNGVIDVDHSSGNLDECDDGNTVDVGDGCKNNCQEETGWICEEPNPSLPSECLTMYWSDTSSGANRLSTFTYPDSNPIYIILKGSLVTGKQYTVEIVEDDPLADDDIKTFPTGTASSELVSIPWTITSTEWDAGKNQFLDDDRNDNPMQLEFYFKETQQAITGTTETSIDNEYGVSPYTGILTVTETAVGTDCEADLGGTICTDPPGCDIDGEISGATGVPAGSLCCVTACALPSNNCPDDDVDLLAPDNEQCDLGPSATNPADWTAANCVMPDPFSAPTNPDRCKCEPGYGDDPNSNGCIPDPTIVTGCNVYDDKESDCLSTGNGIYFDDTTSHPQNNLLCTYHIISNCEFTAGPSPTGTCSGPSIVDEFADANNPSTCDAINPTGLDCNWDTTIEGDCSAGAEDVRFVYSVRSGSDVGCEGLKPPTQIRVCPQRVLLPFFTWINLLITIIVLVIVYYLLIHFGKGKKRK